MADLAVTLGEIWPSTAVGHLATLQGSPQEKQQDGGPGQTLLIYGSECDEVLLTKLLEGLGCEFAPVVQDDAVWGSKVCDVLCQSLNDPLCVWILMGIALHTY